MDADTQKWFVKIIDKALHVGWSCEGVLKFSIARMVADFVDYDGSQPFPSMRFFLGTLDGEDTEPNESTT